MGSTPRFLMKNLRLLAVVLLPLFFVLPDRAADAASAPLPTDPAAAQARIAELRVEIARADELYFKEAAPVLADADYDRLKRELAMLEQAYPQFATEPAAATLGDDRSGRFPTARHRVRTLGLAKSYSRADLDAFFARVTRTLGRTDVVYVVEPKFDGLSISITYEHGRLVRAITRGNGDEGDDVTANVRTIRGLPATLRPTSLDGTANPIPDIIELRGEIYIGYAEFKRINAAQEAAGEETFAHPRNLAAGTLKQTDPAAVAERKLEIVFYGIGACEPAATAPVSQQALHARIRAWGLPGVETDCVAIAHNPAEAWTAVETIGRERAHFPYPTDGAVVKVDDVAQQQVLGVAPDVPNWAMAYKFVPPRAETRIRAIAVQIGRTGVLTPVAELEPVQLGGSRIARASLHNFDDIQRRDIRVGDFVFIEKAGEIIPTIASVDAARRTAAIVPYVTPIECPECGHPVARNRGEAAVRCTNFDCPAQVRRRIEHFASDDCLDIKGLGPALIGRLVKSGTVKSPADLYRLRREDLMSAGGAGAKTADRVLAAIERSKGAERWRFILGLGISGVGPATARSLADHFADLNAFARAAREDFFTDAGVPRIAGIGAVAGEGIAVFLSEPANRGMIEALISVLASPAEAGSAAGSDKVDA